LDDDQRQRKKNTVNNTLHVRKQPYKVFANDSSEDNEMTSLCVEGEKSIPGFYTEPKHQEEHEIKILSYKTSKGRSLC
jgi:hypothetical protein